jgi:predicted NBD/HSP70 family sugar kinase
MQISEQTLNRLTVLKAIRRSGPISRSDLLQATGLSAGSITNLTSDLLERGLIVETRSAAKRAGRPRLYLEIAAQAAVVIGASVAGQNTLTAAFVDLAGTLLFSTDVTYDPPSTLDEQAERIAWALAKALDRIPFDRAAVKRVGIAIPGVVDSGRGYVHFVTTLPGGPTPFARIISDRLGLPVTIEHDLACMARAEHWFGRARELDTFTLVHVGHAIGSAEYVDGVPRCGANGLNPELGHVKTDFGAHARQCICGARGCAVMYCSMFGMLAAARMLEGVPFPPLDRIDADFERLMRKAEVPGSPAADVVSEAADHLGRAVANLLNATDPGHVLISVLNAELLGRFQGEVRNALKRYTLPAVLTATDIQFIVVDQNWRRTGTAALALEQTYLGEN